MLTGREIAVAKTGILNSGGWLCLGREAPLCDLAAVHDTSAPRVEGGEEPCASYCLSGVTSVWEP